MFFLRDVSLSLVLCLNSEETRLDALYYGDNMHGSDNFL